MITTVELALLPPGLQMTVLEQYRKALMDPNRPMTYQEAAWLYGYRYNTIRLYVSEGSLATVGRKPNKRITHQAMRDYMNRKRVDGAPRRALKEAQQQLA